MWMQKLRVNWIIQGDRNTEFYHTVTARRRIRNRIQGVWNEQGKWVNNQKDISTAFRNFYRNLLSPSDSLQEEHIKD